MTFKEIFNFQLIKTETFEITIYHILISTFLIIITWLLLKTLKKIFQRQVITERIDKGNSNSIFLIIKYITWVIVIGVVLDILGVKLTLLIAGSAALLVGIGLGIQQIFNDIASGLFILFERNLKVNDVVQIEENIIGRVLSIGLRTSKLETRDNIIMIIPNSKFISDNVINWSHIEVKTRFKVEIGVAYGSDVELVKNVLLECAKQHKDITNKPKAFVRFDDFGDSSLDFQLLFWTRKAFRVENIKSDLRFQIDIEFRKNDIIIPFPQTDVHLKKN